MNTKVLHKESEVILQDVVIFLGLSYNSISSSWGLSHRKETMSSEFKSLEVED